MGLGRMLVAACSGRQVGRRGCAIALKYSGAVIVRGFSISSSSTTNSISSTRPGVSMDEIRGTPCLMLFSHRDKAAAAADDWKRTSKGKEDKDDDDDYFELMNIARKEVMHLRKNRRTIWFGEDLSPYNGSDCVGFSKGWLAYINRESGAFYLFNPLVEQSPLLFPFVVLPPIESLECIVSRITTTRPKNVSTNSYSSQHCTQFLCAQHSHPLPPHKLGHSLIKKVALSCPPLEFSSPNDDNNFIINNTESNNNKPTNGRRISFANPSSLMIILGGSGQGAMSQLAYCQTGSRNWCNSWCILDQPTASSSSCCEYEDILFSAKLSTFLVLTSNGTVEGCSAGCTIAPIRTTITNELPPTSHVPHHHVVKRYLVEAFGHFRKSRSSLKLLQVLRYFCTEKASTIAFEVYLLEEDYKNTSTDSRGGRWVPLRNLGDYSLFLGRNESMCVSVADVPGIQKNCIYYTNDLMSISTDSEEDSKVNDVGMFDLDTRKCTLLHHSMNSKEEVLPSAPVWISPMTDYYTAVFP